MIIVIIKYSAKVHILIKVFIIINMYMKLYFCFHEKHAMENSMARKVLATESALELYKLAKRETCI